ncbi:MAG: hypothetical protein V3W04_12910 [Gammaproteobacteria bacterium]
MNKQSLGAVSACILSLGFASADAALLSRLGGQALYDTERDITWLADANLVASNSFGLRYDTDLGNHPLDPGAAAQSERINFNNTVGGPRGTMDFGAALHFIDAMNADGGTGYLGFNDWRLPTTLIPDSSCANTDGSLRDDSRVICTGSELGHLFYGIFDVDKSSRATGATADPVEFAKFSNIGLAINGYWSGTPLAGDDSRQWFFRTDFAIQTDKRKTSDAFVLPVRNGDVSAVPVPAAFWLLASGLFSLLGLRKGRRSV